MPQQFHDLPGGNFGSIRLQTIDINSFRHALPLARRAMSGGGVMGMMT
jgi:hypothetical protein